MTSDLQKFFYKNNRLQQLRGFCYVAQFGNISQAAAHMGLTHSSVSLQIKSLSDDLGIPLIKRKGPKIWLTAEGEKLFKLAQPLVDGIHNLHYALADNLQQSRATELNIGLNSTSLNFIFPKIAKKYTDENPDCRLVLHYTEHEEALAKIAADQIDFAILPRRAHMPFSKDFTYMPMFYYTPSLITLPNHPLAGRKNLSAKEIAQHELTLPARDLRVIPNLYDIFDEHSHDFQLRVSFENWETTRKYIEEGLVISISSDVIIGENDKLVATPLDHLFDLVDYGVVLKRGKRIPEKVDRLIHTAKQFAAQNASPPAEKRINRTRNA